MRKRLLFFGLTLCVLAVSGCATGRWFDENARPQGDKGWTIPPVYFDPWMTFPPQ